MLTVNTHRFLQVRSPSFQGERRETRTSATQHLQSFASLSRGPDPRTIEEMAKEPLNSVEQPLAFLIKQLFVKEYADEMQALRTLNTHLLSTNVFKDLEKPVTTKAKEAYITEQYLEFKRQRGELIEKLTAKVTALPLDETRNDFWLRQQDQSSYLQGRITENLRGETRVACQKVLNSKHLLRLKGLD